MFIKTVKIKRPKLIFGVVIALIAAVVIILTVIGIGKSRQRSVMLSSETERQAFISEMGWQAGTTFDSCKKVIIPEEWNEVYESYNELQKQQGFDLAPYKGCEVEIYTYSILNYPAHENDGSIILNLMLYKNRLIGGDVCCTALDGFMQGLMNSEQ